MNDTTLAIIGILGIGSAIPWFITMALFLPDFAPYSLWVWIPIPVLTIYFLKKKYVTNGTSQGESME